MGEIHAYGRLYLPVQGVRYGYAADKCRCPICAGLGLPWQGWFCCDGLDSCQAIALVEGGQVFLPEKP